MLPFLVSKMVENFCDYLVRYRFKKISMIEQAIKRRLKNSYCCLPPAFLVAPASTFVRLAAVKYDRSGSLRTSGTKNKVRDRSRASE